MAGREAGRDGNDRQPGSERLTGSESPGSETTPYNYNNYCEDEVLIHRLQVSGLLSFGPNGIDLPLRDLNVLIGPNGSGKSNLLEILGLLRGSTGSIADLMRSTGGVSEWLWKGKKPGRLASICAHVEDANGNRPIRHLLQVIESGGLAAVVNERIEDDLPHGSVYYDSRALPVPTSRSDETHAVLRDSVSAEQSILSRLGDAESHPVLSWLQQQYESIRLYRNWSFGPSAPWRQEHSARGGGMVLTDSGENLAFVLSVIRRAPHAWNELFNALRDLLDDVVDIQTRLRGDHLMLSLVEASGQEIPASRLSDGTLRYLSLLTILLHPDPPPLVAIEEPELGVHPDLMHCLAELLVRASKRMQLVVTTHDRLLVDALSDHPSSIIVCEKEDGESRFEGLDSARLKAWLDEYSLGQLWSKGELGGNRW
jgi:predicted ATPase